VIGAALDLVEPTRILYPLPVEASTAAQVILRYSSCVSKDPTELPGRQILQSEGSLCQTGVEKSGPTERIARATR
jgi:hypothetical protein